MDLKIIDLPADDAVLDIDDVEFFDWSKNNSSSRLWYCKEVVSSPMLLTAIQNAIERSPTDYLAKKMSLITDVQPHFLGFVSAQMQDTIVKLFHLNSFVLYYPHAEVVDEDVAYLTVVILTHTSRIHILSNMSDRLLQFIQLIRFCESKVFTTTITNKFIGKEATIDQVSIDGYSSMGFNVQSITQAVVEGEFNVVTNNPIPLIEYGNSYS